MANRKLGHFLYHKTVVLIIGGALPRADKLAAAGCFSPVRCWRWD